MAAKGRPATKHVQGAALVGLAMTFTNVCSYGFVVLAAQLLSPATYGEVGAIMGLLLVLGVVAVGLQASAARAVATRSGDLGTVEARTLRSGVRAALILLVAGLLASPLVAMALGLSTPLTAVYTAVAAAVLALMGAAAGLMQGERQWHGFAAVQLASGVGRLAVAGTVVLLWSSAAGAAFGVALGSLLPMLMALFILRRRRSSGTASAAGKEVPAGSATTAANPARSQPNSLGILAVLRDSHLLLALLVLSNMDILLARMILSEHDSGLYAAGLIITKTVLFLPQFVVTVAFPDLVERGAVRALRITLVAVLTTGIAAVVAIAVLAPIALLLVGGQDYADVRGQLWCFALLGTVLSLVTVYVFRFLATARAHVEWWVWAAVLVVLGCATLVDSITQLLTVMVVVDLALLALLAWIELRSRRAPASTPQDQRALADAVSAPPRARTHPDQR